MGQERTGTTRRDALALGAALAAAPGLAAAADDPFARDQIAADLAVFGTFAHLRSGGPGELALSQRMEARLAGAGFTIRKQPLRAPFFEAKRTALLWPGGEVEVFAQQIVAPTGPAGVSAPLQLWREGDDPALIRGKIALVLLPRARHSQLKAPLVQRSLAPALAAAPAGVVLITEGPTGETIILNAPFDRPISPVPIAVLGPKPGAAALEAARGGAAGTLILDGTQGHRDTHNLIGRIDRPGAKTLVVSTPRTGWTPAAAERGPGVAAWLALARWAPAALPGWSLLFLATTAHEYDNAGGLLFLGSAEAPAPERTALWTHLGAGFAGRGRHDLGGYRLAPLPSVDDQRFLVGSPALVERLRAAFAGQPGLEAAYPASAGAAGELGEILHAGYDPAFGLFGAHIKHHVMTDLPGETDAAWVQAAAAAARNVIVGVLGGKS